MWPGPLSLIPHDPPAKVQEKLFGLLRPAHYFFDLKLALVLQNLIAEHEIWISRPAVKDPETQVIEKKSARLLIDGIPSPGHRYQPFELILGSQVPQKGMVLWIAVKGNGPGIKKGMIADQIGIRHFHIGGPKDIVEGGRLGLQLQVFDALFLQGLFEPMIGQALESQAEQKIGTADPQAP